MFDLNTKRCIFLSKREKISQKNNMADCSFGDFFFFPYICGVNLPFSRISDESQIVDARCRWSVDVEAAAISKTRWFVTCVRTRK